MNKLGLKQIEGLKRSMLNCNVFSVYDYDGLSMLDLLNQFFTKINQCVDIANKTVVLVEWLVDQGLSEEVAKKLNQWLIDGTLANIINETVFAELNRKVILNQNEINKIKKTLEVHVHDFGAIGDGQTDDTVAIQKAIDFVHSEGGGNIHFGNNEYKTTKPLYLYSHINLIGEGRNTKITKVKGGKRELSPTTDFETASREFMLLYDACIVGEYNLVYFSIKGIHIQSDNRNDRCKWGVLLPYCALGVFEQFTSDFFDEHIRIFNAWNMNFNSVRCIHGEYGIRLQHGNTDNIDTACTSWVMNRVFCEYVDYGYLFVGLQYSSLNAMCADQINLRAYTFNYCYGVSINGMGCENSTGQLIRNKMSQLSIQGAFFLTMNGGRFPSDSISQALIEIDTQGRAGCGITMNDALFKNNNSGKKLLYISEHGNFTGSDIRVNDGAQIHELETGSTGGFTNNNPWSTETINKDLVANGIRVNKVTSGYNNAQGKMQHFPGFSVYNDVGNTTESNKITISRSEIAKNFGWVNGTDNYVYIPLKISVTSEFNGSCNHIWNAQNSVISTNKTVLGTDIVNNITTDGNNLIINLTEAKSRVKVVISIA